MSHVIEDEILTAAATLLAERGWSAVTLEGVAERSGVSRATLYRRGITREAIAAALAERAAAGWKAAIWPALTAPGTAAERFELAIRASCAAIELHAGFLETATVNPIVDIEASPPIATPLGNVFVDPFARLLADGAADGSLTPVSNPQLTATLIFTSISRGYLAARGVAGVTADQAAQSIVELILGGILASTATLRTATTRDSVGGQSASR